MTREELRQWRKGRKLTLAKLAKLLGVHWTAIAKWERGERGIPALLPLALEALEHRLRKEEKGKKEAHLS
jgi:transcriptional regulator with XRE-family HTH domain